MDEKTENNNSTPNNNPAVDQPSPAPTVNESTENTPAPAPTESYPPANVTKEAPNVVEPENPVESDMAKGPAPEQKKKKTAIILITVFAVLLIGIIIIISSLSKKDETVDNGRTKVLSEIKENKVLEFEIDGNTYRIGDTVEKLLSDFEINKSFSQIKADNIMMTPFNKDNEASFLGLLYCPSESPCNYEDSKLIKANFYNNSNVRIGGKISFSSSIGDLKSEYGEPDGKYYQDKTMSVWSFGNNVGDAYLVAGFDDGGLFSLGYANRIMLGVWWYDGEYEDTIIKGEK